MFDMNQRKDLSGSTVAGLIDALQKLRPSAAVCCCGDNHMFLHVEKDGSAVNLDVEDLDACYADDPATPSEDYWGAYQGELERINGAAVRHGLLSKWKRRLEALRDQICSRLVMDWRKDYPSYQEFVLQDQLRRSEGNITFLQEELKKARERIYDLERMTRECSGRLASILAKSDTQLRAGLHFDVWKAEAGEQWEVVTEHCCLGGCDMGIYEFAAERDALLFAALLDTVGFKPAHNTACSTCYAEYIKDCV